MGPMLSAFSSFFTIGYHTKVLQQTGVVIQQDGYIASLLAGILVTSYFIGLSLSRYMIYDVTRWISLPQLQTFLIAFVGANVVGLLFLICRAKPRRRQQSSRATSLISNWRQHAQTVIPLFGMLVFLLGIMLLDLSMCYAYLACLASTGACYQRTSGYIGMMYHLLRCVFSICIYLFICIYSSSRCRRFTSPVIARYLLCLMVACMLFLYYELESYFIAGAPVDYFDQCNQEPDTLSRDEKCTCLMSDEFIFAYDVQGELHPFYVEFFLLATERVLHMFSSQGNDEDDLIDRKHCLYRKFQKYIKFRVVCC